MKNIQNNKNVIKMVWGFLQTDKYKVERKWMCRDPFMQLKLSIKNTVNLAK